ncbi:MAG: type IIL restriction-modification enzyme MmeI [Acinetobacter sp.]
MPESLRKAHQDNDRLVDSIYCQKGFKTDEERLAMLFNLYKKNV